MKKKILIIIMLLVISTGCLKRDNMDNINIITTTYPIMYLVDNIYGYNSTVSSIYPRGVNTNKYTLTDKQIRDYSLNDMFIYNGLSNEKKIAGSLISENKNIKVIDTTKGLGIKSRVEELWISPSNYLMLAQNIKNELINYVNTTIVKQEIEANYENTKLIISKFDAELKLIAEKSDNKTIIAGDSIFTFLEKYGFNVISIYDNDKFIQKNYQEAKNNITNKRNSYIFVLEDYDKKNEDIKALVGHGAKTIEVKTMTNLTEEEYKNGTDYIKLMNNFIESIKMETYNS